MQRHGRSGVGQLARAELLRRSFSRFVRAAWHVNEPATPLEWNWHLDALCDHLQAMVEDWIRIQLERRERIEPDSLEGREARRLGLHLVDGRVADEVVQRIQNLLINVPPGTGKSRVVSVMLLPWVWTRWPSWRAKFLSVNPGVAMRDAVFCRELLRSTWYRDTFQSDWELSEDQDAKGLFKNTKGGWRRAIGYFAGAVGDRDDAEVVDDANDPDDVHSEKSRDAVNNRWDDTLKNRLNDLRSSLRMLIQQRVHTEDQSGHVLADTSMPWVHLRITMEREADDKGCECPTCKAGVTPIGWRDPRAPGELLDPKRFPEEVLATFRAKSYVWTSQYQQRPVPTAGNLFNPSWWRFWRHSWEAEIPALAVRTVVIPERFDWTALSWDCSFKETKTSDFVAGGAWSGVGALRYLRALAWDRMDIVKTMEQLERQIADFPEYQECLVEEAANGHAVLQLMRSKIRGIIGVTPEGGKASRAAAGAPQVEAGQVFLPLHAPWRDRYIAQHTAFPNGANDDAVDQQSQILLRKQSLTGGSVFKGKVAMGTRRM